MVENLPANAGHTGSSPGLGRSRMPRSSWAREPQLLSLHVWSLCSTTREAAIVRGPRTAMKSGPHLSQLEKALAQKRRPNTAKNKYIKKLIKQKQKTNTHNTHTFMLTYTQKEHKKVPQWLLCGGRFRWVGGQEWKRDSLFTIYPSVLLFVLHFVYVLIF